MTLGTKQTPVPTAVANQQVLKVGDTSSTSETAEKSVALSDVKISELFQKIKKYVEENPWKSAGFAAGGILVIKLLLGGRR